MTTIPALCGRTRAASLNPMLPDAAAAVEVGAGAAVTARHGGDSAVAYES